VKHHVEYMESARDDLAGLDNSVAQVVRKAITKVSTNPLPKNEGGYGSPLGNKNNAKLTNCCKIKLRHHGIRVVYKIVKDKNVMKIIVIAARADDEVYEIAASRLNSCSVTRT